MKSTPLMPAEKVMEASAATEWSNWSSPNLPVLSFGSSKEGEGYVGANTDLVLSTSNRLSLDDRYGIVTTYLARQLNVSKFQLVETGPQNIPGWIDALVVSPTDLASYLGLDIIGTQDRHGLAYAKMIYPLIGTRFQTDIYLGDGVKLSTDIASLWLSLRDIWQPRRPLSVRKMSVNPTTRFECQNGILSRDKDRWYTYAASSLVARRLSRELPAGFPIRSAICGDLTTLACLAIAEPGIFDQIRANTAPSVDIPGTDIFIEPTTHGRPRCRYYDGRIVLECTSDWSASRNAGSLLIAQE